MDKRAVINVGEDVPLKMLLGQEKNYGEIRARRRVLMAKNDPVFMSIDKQAKQAK